MVGPTKWDNVPGWAFGAGGGFNYVKWLDVADFVWEWTFSYQPETVGFYYLVPLAANFREKKGAVISVLQTESKVQTEAKVRTESKAGLPTHGNTWIGHTWCSPDWFSYPM